MDLDVKLWDEPDKNMIVMFRFWKLINDIPNVYDMKTCYQLLDVQKLNYKLNIMVNTWK